jgi:hypothetical protein
MQHIDDAYLLLSRTGRHAPGVTARHNAAMGGRVASRRGRAGPRRRRLAVLRRVLVAPVMAPVRRAR